MVMWGSTLVSFIYRDIFYVNQEKLVVRTQPIFLSISATDMYKGSRKQPFINKWLTWRSHLKNIWLAQLGAELLLISQNNILKIQHPNKTVKSDASST